MKNVFTAIGICISFFAFSQKDTTTRIDLGFVIAPKGAYGYSFNDVPNTIFWSDGRIELRNGQDTLKSMKALFDHSQKMEKKYWAANIVLYQLNLDNLVRLLKTKDLISAVKNYRKSEKDE